MRAIKLCTECGWCEYAPNMRRGLCWRPCAGPEIIDMARTGGCGFECRPSLEVYPRDRWLEYHGHPARLLQEVLLILRWASAGAVEKMRREAGDGR